MKKRILKAFAHVTDGAIRRAMHAAARRQADKVEPSLAGLEEPVRDNPVLLFQEPAALSFSDIRGAAWERRGGFWRRDFAFPSALSCPYPCNDHVFVQTYSSDRQLHLPAVIVLHGLMNLSMLSYRPFFRAAVDHGAAAYALELPYHHRRTPNGSISGDLFHTANLELTLLALKQAVADTRRLVRYLRAAEAPTIGLLGFSLGAWIAALVACCEPEIDFALLAMPPSGINDLVWSVALGRELRERFLHAGWSPDTTSTLYGAIDPIQHRPLMAPERIELFAAEYDTVVSLENVLALREAWSISRLHTYSHGHISIMLSPKLRREVRQALGRQLALGSHKPKAVTVVTHGVDGKGEMEIGKTAEQSGIAK